MTTKFQWAIRKSQPVKGRSNGGMNKGDENMGENMCPYTELFKCIAMEFDSPICSEDIDDSTYIYVISPSMIWGIYDNKVSIMNFKESNWNFVTDLHDLDCIEKIKAVWRQFQTIQKEKDE